MAKRLYIGNLPYGTDEVALRDLLAQYGEVESVEVATDRETGQSRGFAFAEMANEAAAQSVIDNLNGYQLDGRSITVQEARPRAEATGGGRRSFGGGRRYE